MFKRFVKIPGESATDRYERFIKHQSEAARHGHALERERRNAAKAANTNFNDLFSDDSQSTNTNH